MGGPISLHNEFPLGSDWYEWEGFGDILLHTGLQGAGAALVLMAKMWRKSHSAVSFADLPLIARTFGIEYDFLIRVVNLGIKRKLFQGLNLQVSEPQASQQLALSEPQANTSKSVSKSVSQSINQEGRENFSHFFSPHIKKKFEAYQSRVEACRASGARGGRKAADNRPPTFPPEINTPECRQAWRDWLEHKKSKGKGYKSVKSQEAMLKQKSKIGPARFCEAVQFSIGSNYDGIFESQENGNGRRLKPLPFPEAGL